MNCGRWGACGACVIALFGLIGPAIGAPITFNTALPVAEGEFVLREQFFFIKSSDDPSPADRDAEVIGGLSVLAYGVTSDLALFGALPVLDKSLELDTPEGRRVERGDTGIGDARLFGRYTVFQDDVPGRNFRIAPFVGLELPTGDDDEHDGLGRLPQPLQLGSGSWDPFFGVVGTWQTLDYQIDAQASYQINTPKRAVGEAGDGPGQFNAPGGVALAESGDLFVADFYNHRVQHLKPDGTFVAQWGTTGEPGRWAGRFIYPTDAAMGSDSAVYVADGYGDRIQVLAPEDGLLRKWGGPFALDIFGPFNGWFAVVTSIAVGPDGGIFAADFYNDRVQKFAADGTFLTAFGETGDGPGQFGHAMAIAVADDGTVFVADFLNNRIQKWRPSR